MAAQDDSENGEYVGDSPGPPIEYPDEPVAADKPGTTAEEQRESSLERRLAMEESERPGLAASGRSSRGIVDDDVPTDELVSEDPDLDPEIADLDRTSEEVGEESLDPDEGPEGSAMHIERE